MSSESVGGLQARIRTTWPNVARHLSAWANYVGDRRAVEEFPAGRPIFITGAPRSGTTWVAAMLAAPGIWYIHEPFNPNKGLWHQEFTYVSPQNPRSDVDQMLDRILHWRARRALYILHAEHPLMPLRFLPVRPRQLLLKDPLACLMADHVTERLGAQTLVLFRHPAGFVRSFLDLGWPTANFLQQFLDTPLLMQECLAAHEKLIRRYSEKEGLESAVVLHGCIYSVLWRTVQNNPEVLMRRFEDLASDPIEQFSRLYCELNLPYTDAVRRQHRELTGCGVKVRADAGPHSVRRDSRAMARKWRGSFAPSELDRIETLWREFDIPLYNDESEWAG